MYTALTGARLPGHSTAVAEGNAMGKGPVVFELYQSGVKLIHKKAASEIPFSSPGPPSLKTTSASLRALYRKLDRKRFKYPSKSRHQLPRVPAKFGKKCSNLRMPFYMCHKSACNV